MRVFVVIPCLNEAAGVRETCASLGAATARDANEVTFVLVDNASDDDTWALMRALRDEAAPGAVEIRQEIERGHVPARTCGMQAVLDHVSREGLDPGTVLTLQADGDTRYEPGYLEAMIAAAQRAGPGSLLEGRSTPPAAALDRCARFRALEHVIDAPFVAGLDPALDVLVDDKIVGYRLSDYMAWGGLKREFDAQGDEILAETTRMFLTARIMGADRVTVDDAVAVTTQRHVLANPSLVFATADFPRGRIWADRWRGAYCGPAALEDFAPDADLAAIATAIEAREKHLLALFSYVPAIVGSALGKMGASRDLLGLGPPTADEARVRPGLVFEWAFAAAKL